MSRTPQKNEKPAYSARQIESGAEKVVASETSDPWVLTVTTEEEESKPAAGTLPRRGPTHKVLLEVDGVESRALIDHGAQISLVRQELLPIIRQKYGWTVDQYCHCNLELDRQPVGAGGEALGVMALVVFKITIDGASTPFYVPCYVLQSCKPLWKGELYHCALILGTNALETMGFRITHPMRTAEPQSKSDAEVYVVLSQQLQLGPFQFKIVKASTSSVSSDQELRVKLVNLNDNLADRQCDFIVEVWEGKSTGELRITNWSGETLS